MMGLGQCLRDPQSLMIGEKPRGNLPRSDCSSVCQGGAEVSSTRQRSPWVNLRRSLWVGALECPSPVSVSYHLSLMITCLLSSELKCLDIGIAALSEVWRPDCGETMVCGYTKYENPASCRGWAKPRKGKF